MADFYTDDFPGMALHQLMNEMREQGPVVPIQFLGIPSWLITQHTQLEHAFKDTENLPPHKAYLSCIAPLLGENFQSMEGDRHRLFRKLATPTFRPRQIEKMDFDMLAAVADELINVFIQDSRADLVQQFAEWVVAILNFSVNTERTYKCRNQLWAYLDPEIQERIKSPWRCR